MTIVFLMLSMLLMPLMLALAVAVLSRGCRLFFRRDGMAVSLTVRHDVLGWLPYAKQHYRQVLGVRMASHQGNDDGQTYEAGHLVIKTERSDVVMTRLGTDRAEEVQALIAQIQTFLVMSGQSRLTLRGHYWQRLLASNGLLAFMVAMPLYWVLWPMYQHGKDDWSTMAAEFWGQPWGERVSQITGEPIKPLRPSIDMPSGVPVGLPLPQSASLQQAHFDEGKQQWRLVYDAVPYHQNASTLAHQLRDEAKAMGWQVSQLRTGNNLHDFGYRKQAKAAEGEVYVLALQDKGTQVWVLSPVDVDTVDQQSQTEASAP